MALWFCCELQGGSQAHRGRRHVLTFATYRFPWASRCSTELLIPGWAPWDGHSSSPQLALSTCFPSEGGFKSLGPGHFAGVSVGWFVGVPVFTGWGHRSCGCCSASPCAVLAGSGQGRNSCGGCAECFEGFGWKAMRVLPVLGARKSESWPGVRALCNEKLLPSETVRWAGARASPGLDVGTGQRDIVSPLVALRPGQPHPALSCLCSTGSSASPSTTARSPAWAAGLARSCWGGRGASLSSSTSSPHSRITLPASSTLSVPRLAGNDAVQPRWEGDGHRTGLTPTLSLPPHRGLPGPAGTAQDMSSTKELGRVTLLSRD